MKAILKKLINGALRPLDLEVRRFEPLRVDPKKYLRAIEELLGCYAQLGVADLPPSKRRVELMARLHGTQVSEAVYLLKYLHESLAIEGGVCEFGVAAGATSALMANELRETNKDLWLFDSFQGLPKPTGKDLLIDDILGIGTIEQYEGRMAFGEWEVRDRLKNAEFPLSRVHIVPGFIEKTINSRQLPETVAFAYVDFDFYEPIRIALEYLDRCMPPGGHIMVDDYGFFSAGAQAAVDEFAAARKGQYEPLLPYKFAGHFIALRKRA